MKFWEAMREMQENRKSIRCKRWKPEYEWHLGDDISLPQGCEWELYSEPEKTLTFAEVIVGLHHGKAFKRIGWHSDIYLTARTHSGRVILENSSYHTLLLEDYDAKDWTEVT